MIAEPESSLLTGKKYFFGVHKVETTFGFNSCHYLLRQALGILDASLIMYKFRLSSEVVTD